MVRSKSSAASTFVSEVGSSCLSAPRLRKVDVLGMIAGLESVTAGVLRIDGRVVNQVERRAREIAMVFQGVMMRPGAGAYALVGPSLLAWRLAD